MPYIPPEKRLAALNGDSTSGDLCYYITRICQTYLNQKGASFEHFGEIRNALESTWDVHFYPKLMKHEDGKRYENGDVK